MAKETLKEQKSRVARDNRVAKVKAEIEAARVSREKLEVDTGLIESPAVGKEREEAEKEKLAEASKIRLIERIEPASGNVTGDQVTERLNEVIDWINGQSK